MTTAALLHEVDRLPPGERVARVIAVAREVESSDPQHLSEMLGELSALDAYARRLAVLMAGAVGRGGFLANAVDDVDSSVASLALAAPALPEEVIVDVLERGSLQLRRLEAPQLKWGL
jgi:hypothetical protein